MLRIAKVYSINSMPSGMYARSEDEWEDSMKVYVNPNDNFKTSKEIDNEAFGKYEGIKRDWWESIFDVASSAEEGDPTAFAFFEWLRKYRATYYRPAQFQEVPYSNDMVALLGTDFYELKNDFSFVSVEGKPHIPSSY